MKSKLLKHIYNIEDPLDRATWYVLINKIAYYYPNMFNIDPVNDRAYDEFEKGYLKLCTKNEFVHKEYPEYSFKGNGMLEVDFTHPKVIQIVDFIEKIKNSSQ